MGNKRYLLFLNLLFLYISVNAAPSELQESAIQTVKRTPVRDIEPNPWWYCNHPGWLYFEGNCYTSVQSQSTFFAAQFYCKSMGSSLVDISSEDELNFVGNSISCWNEHWMDGVFVYMQGDPCCSPSNWVKYDGTPMSSYGHWYDWTHDLGACLLSDDYGWRSMSCNEQTAFVCKRPANMNSQVIERSAKQILKDERLACRDGWHSYNGSCYWTSAEYNISLDFFAAQLYCRYQFGDYAADLTSITSSLEANFVYQNLMNCNQSSYCDASNCTATWCGLVNIDSDHMNRTTSWRWDDNQPMAVSHWQPGYPTADWESECGAIVNRGMWQNLGCYQKLPFVCKGAAELHPEQNTTAASIITTSFVDTICPDPSKNPCQYNSVCKNTGHSAVCTCMSPYTRGTYCDACEGLLPAASNTTHLLESVHYPQLFTNTSCTWTIPFRGGYEAVQFNVTDLMIGNETTDYLEFVVGTVVTQRLVPMSNISSAIVIVTTNSTLGNISINFYSTSGGYFSLSYATVDPCLHYPCNAANSICQSLSIGPRCKCSFGFVGQYCDIADPCTGNLCQNGATCLADVSNTTYGYDCVCEPPFSGQFCL